MAAYTRQSSFADGNTINASLFNNEYDALAAAFVNTSGHKHDGTTGEGPVIGVIGDAGIATPLNKVLIDTSNDHIEFYIDVSSSAVQQLYIADGVVAPVTDSDIDLGTSSLYYKNAYIDAITTTGNVAVGGNLTVTGTTTFNGGTLTLGDANTDNIVFGGEVDSNIIPDDDGTYDLGSSSKEWKDIYIDGVAYVDAINFNGTAISATAAELNIMDGVTSTATELNILDGVTSTTAELNILDGVTSTATELNLLDGVTATTTELNYNDTGAAVGTVVASKVVTADANKDVASFRNVTATTFIGNIDAVDGDFDGTLEADAITVGGVALNEFISDTVGAMVTGNTETNVTVTYDDSDNTLDFVVGNITGTAQLATESTITANNSTNETVFPTFVDGATGSQGLETDTGLTYNPSTGLLTSTGFAGALTGNSSTATALATARTIGMTGDVVWTSANFDGSGNVTGSSTIQSSAVETAMIHANVVSGQTSITSSDVDSSNDTLLLHDNSASALKKVTVASIISSAGGLTDVVADTSPQLGGNLDVNGNDIVSTSNANIDIIPNGSGIVNLDGTEISDGLIELKTGTGNVAKVKFYCESSNAHAQTLQAAPHSAGSSAVLVLPTASGNLIGTGDSGTVTNTMLAGSIAGAKIAADAITGAKIADNAIDSEHYTDGSIDTAHIADSQVTTAKIADDNITQAKIANDAIGADELASNAVVNASIASGAAIAFSKMANLTGQRALVSDSNGDVSVASVTDTELGHLSGVTSAIQTQLNNKPSNGFAVAMAIAL